MPRGYRGIILAALVGLIFVSFGTGAFVTVLGGGEGQSEQAIGAHERGREERNHPQQADTERAGIPRFVERRISNPEPQAGDDQEKRDLAAQEASATFAFWMIIVGLTQTLVAGLALFVLLRDLRQGRRSTETQQRVYLRIEVLHIQMMAGEPISFRCRVHNYGKTRAKNFVFDGVAVVRPKGWKWEDEAGGIITRRKAEQFDLQPGDDHRVEMPSDDILTMELLEAIRADLTCVFAHGAVFYDTVFGDSCETRIAVEFSGEECFAVPTHRFAYAGNTAT